jgi:hypothetical protein
MLPETRQTDVLLPTRSVLHSRSQLAISITNSQSAVLERIGPVGAEPPQPAD